MSARERGLGDECGLKRCARVPMTTARQSKRAVGGAEECREMMRAARRTTDGDARGEGARRARGRGNGGTRDAGRRCAPNAEERGRTRKDPIASDSSFIHSHSFSFIRHPSLGRGDAV